MRDRYQGGSLAGFLLIGGLLTLVLVGGLYGLNRYNAEKANNEVAKEESSKHDDATQSGEAATNSGDQKTDTSGRDDVKNDETTSGRADSESTESTGSNDSSSSLRSDSSQTAQSSTNDLPQTGPADTLLSFAALGLVVFAGVHYLQSRKLR